MMLSLAVLGVGGVGVAIAHSTEAPWHWYHEKRKGAELAGHVDCIERSAGVNGCIWAAATLPLVPSPGAQAWSARAGAARMCQLRDLRPAESQPPAVM